DVEVFRYRGALAVWHAVFTQVAGAQVRSDDAQTAAAVSSSRAFPCCCGFSLPARGPSGTALRKVKEPRLRTRVRLEAQGIGILPRDVQPPGHAHDIACTI